MDNYHKIELSSPASRLHSSRLMIGNNDLNLSSPIAKKSFASPTNYSSSSLNSKITKKQNL